MLQSSARSPPSLPWSPRARLLARKPASSRPSCASAATDRAIPHIFEQLDRRGVHVPIIGDFHYNGHILLKKYPACAQALAKYRINPGNVSVGRKDDSNFGTMVQVAVENQKPVRIGVNWGSLDQSLLTRMMDENSRSP